MIDEHARFKIWNQTQHPFKHSLSDFSYVNPALPGVSNIESALNYFTAVMYPKYVGTTDTTSDLPTGVDTPNVGDTTPDINDYRVVLDDGDGKQAGYRWEQREGDLAPKWYKIYDVDWSTDGILAGLMDITQDVYVYQKGKTDLDETGSAITGTFAGQRIWGGNLTGQNLTLDANSKDNTGFIQFNSNLRPTVNDIWSLGTVTEKFTDGFFSQSLNVNTLNLSSGSITDTTGTIDFGDENITTTGNIAGNFILSETFIEMAQIVTPANATAGTDRLYFKADDKLYRLDSSGNELLVGLNFTSTNDNRLVKSNGAAGDAIQETGIIISDLDEISGVTRLDVDNLRVDGNTISTTDVNGDLNLTPSGTGKVVMGVFRSTALTNDRIHVARTDGTLTSTSIGVDASNNVSGMASLLVDNVRLDGNSVSSDAGDLDLVPFSGSINVNGVLTPNADATRDLGLAGTRFNNIFLAGNIEDGTNAISIADLLKLRGIQFRDVAQLQPVQNGDQILYDSTNNVWLAAPADSGINHNDLGNLTIGDAGHTQFALLVGRSGGQSLIGGVSAGENLTLESTSNVTKGFLVFGDTARPDVDATFSTQWDGLDLGSSSFSFRNLYTKGQAFGLRFENVLSSALPTSNANNVGRAVFATDTNKIYVDNGSSFIVAGSGKFVQDIAFNGSETLKDIDVSSSIVDARNAIIQLLDNSNDFERIIATIKATSASNVRLQTNIALSAGSYRLIVME